MKKKKKIIWIYRVNADANGHITTWRGMYNELSKEYDIIFIFPYENTKTSFTNNVTYVKKITNIPGLKLLSYIFFSFTSFVKLNNKYKPDFVILDFYSFFFTIIYILKKDRPKVILDFRTPIHNERKESGFLFELMKVFTKLILNYNRLYHNGVSFISNSLKETYEKDLSVNLNNKIHIWPSGVDNNHFTGDYKSLDLSFPFHFFFHGGLSFNRGLDELIDAFYKAKNNNISIHLTIVGDGPNKDSLLKKVTEKNLEKYVSILPSVTFNEIPYLIMRSHICVLTYPKIKYWEDNVPLKLLEYMSMKKPLLLTDLDCFKLITKDGLFCEFIENNNSDNIYNGIINSINNYQNLSKHTNTERKIIESQYSWNIIAQFFSKFLSQL